jgi:AcrR family transcriptional regulator
MSAWPAEPRSPFVRTGARERQRAATRERLFTAALAEFRRAGFERANVAEIARAAGVSRPSFYAHFPTLDHVLFEWAWRLALGVVRRLAGAEGLRETLDREQQHAHAAAALHFVQQVLNALGVFLALVDAELHARHAANTHALEELLAQPRLRLLQRPDKFFFDVLLPRDRRAHEYSRRAQVGGDLHAVEKHRRRLALGQTLEEQVA